MPMLYSEKHSGQYKVILEESNPILGYNKSCYAWVTVESY